MGLSSFLIAKIKHGFYISQRFHTFFYIGELFFLSHAGHVTDRRHLGRKKGGIHFVLRSVCTTFDFCGEKSKIGGTSEEKKKGFFLFFARFALSLSPSII